MPIDGEAVPGEEGSVARRIEARMAERAVPVRPPASSGVGPLSGISTARGGAWGANTARSCAPSVV